MKWQAALAHCAFFFMLSGLVMATSSEVFGRDLDRAPPPFGFRDGAVVPVDFSTVVIDYIFNAATQRTTAHAIVTFDADQAGFPMMDMVPNATAVILNGESLTPADFPVVSAPGNVTTFRVLHHTVAAGTRNVLELDFALGSNVVTFAGTAVRTGFFMDDLTDTGRGFFEQYGPANFEFDQVHYTFHVHVLGTNAPHEIFTNGEVTGDASNWTVDFPGYFTTSSIYFHLTESNRFYSQRYTYSGLEANIPVTVYSGGASSTANAVASSRQIMEELERTYGAFAHERLVIYIATSGGGMEYGGATMTIAADLGHELTHSWFARGVMPSNANSGWIDEAIASWRDNGYPRATRSPSRASVNLGGFSPYRRNTTNAAYTEGAQLISEFDYLFAAQGGMRPVLRSFYGEQKRHTISVQDFKSFLETSLGSSLTPIFNRYVYGSPQFEADSHIATDSGNLAVPTSITKRRFTAAELAVLR